MFGQFAAYLVRAMGRPFTKARDRARIDDALRVLTHRRRRTPSTASTAPMPRRSANALSVILLELDYDDARIGASKDKLLRAFAIDLRAKLRAMDSSRHYEGTKFLAILPETDSVGVQIVAARIQKSLAQLHMEACMGVVTFNASQFAQIAVARRGKHLMATAERALKAAKAAGRNRLVYKNKL
ncbi:MAG: diguanylate cyclase [Gammaproteobacteria bacterium]|nr:diguanylate cyclase [Gammaproteobacteria bacterium]